MNRPTAGLEREHARAPLNLAWLIRLRWGAIVGQAIAVLVTAQVVGVPLPGLWMWSLIGLELSSNVYLVARSRRGFRAGETALAGILGLDVLILTGLLYLTGGPFNPFSFLYLIYISLAVVLLRAQLTWALAGLSLACSAALFVGHEPLALPATTHDDYMRWHLWGMWVALGVAAAYIVYSQVRVLQALTRRERELAEARDLAARQERLASLATLAGGAAHELASPLSTVAVVARELELELSARGAGDDLVEDVRLMRAEIQQCRRILEQMSAQAGESAGEGTAPSSIEELVREALDGIPEVPPVAIDLGAAAGKPLSVTRRALAQALRVLVRNAQDACADGGVVELAVDLSDRALTFRVRDEGSGMDPEVLARAGEPFFTTKQPGQGLGLGLFLCRAVVERLGGQVELRSDRGRGTTASLVLPARAWQPSAEAAEGARP